MTDLEMIAKLDAENTEVISHNLRQEDEIKELRDDAKKWFDHVSYLEAQTSDMRKRLALAEATAHSLRARYEGAEADRHEAVMDCIEALAMPGGDWGKVASAIRDSLGFDHKQGAKLRCAVDDLRSYYWPDEFPPEASE